VLIFERLEDLFTVETIFSAEFEGLTVEKDLITSGTNFILDERLLIPVRKDLIPVGTVLIPVDAILIPVGLVLIPVRRVFNGLKI